jgi:NhaP-type Na+/H+ and K+/H+ antiporter
LISITAQRRVLPKALNQLALISPDVVGPVAAFWDQRLAIQDTDQVSFHTDDAIKLIGEHLKGVEKC